MKTRVVVIGGVAGVALAGTIRWIARRTEGAAAEREPHQPSMTALAGQALARGTMDPPASRRWREPEIPREDETLRIGDPEVDPLDTAYVGDDAPGGDMPTP